MANQIDEELYPRNNAWTTCDPIRWQRNSGTGDAESVAWTGLTDLRVFLAATASADDHTAAIHADLVEVMAEVVSGKYQATISGDAMKTHIASPDGTVLYVHWQSLSSGYHERAAVTWRPNGRPASAT